MTHPKWKTFLSYIKEISLEQTSSPSNPYLEVLLVKGRHQLVTRDAIYSFDDKYENFRIAFDELDWINLPGKRVLLLGLGLGSVIFILEKKMGKILDYTAVEVDSEICRLCNTYTLSDIDSYVEVIPQEAMSFLHVNDESYDMIIMDIFQSAVIPQEFQSIEYLEMLRGKLNKNGLLLYNRMNITDSDQAQNKTFKNTMKTVFPDMSEVKTRTNIIIVNDGNYLPSQAV